MGVMAGLARALLTGGGAAELGRVGTGLAQVFRPDATRQMELGHEAFGAVQQAFAAEFQHARNGWFDRFVDGLNRLPRPVLALATPALFAYAMADPAGFAVRMRGLGEVPEPLWWLLGAVVAFYFGARETHYRRVTRVPAGESPQTPAPAPTPAPGRNPALDAWLEEGRRD